MNVPKLRFNRFKDEYRCISLEDVFDFYRGNTLSKTDLVENGNHKCILYGELYTKYTAIANTIYSKTNNNNENLIFGKKYDVLMPCSGETALDISTTTCLQSDGILIGGDLNILRPKTDFGNYLSYYLFYKKKTEIAKYAQGDSIVHLYTDKIKKLKLNLPSYAEQKMVSNILELLDQKIELQSRKIEDLKLFKKGLFDKLFDEIDGNNYLLSDIASFENGKGHENIIDENGNYILINSKFISTEGNIIKKCSEQLTPLFKNDITMVMSDLPNGKALAKCYYIEEDNKYSLNQRICKIHTKDNKIINSKYLFYLLNRNPYYLKFDDGVNQTNLKKDDILNINLNIPSIDIQDKNSKILTTIDNLIKKELIKLSKLETLKKGLMQNMFV